MSMLAARKGDLLSGHATYPLRPIAQGSSNVNICGQPACYKGCKAEIHNNLLPNNDPCLDTSTSGSGSVNINGQPAARLFDDFTKGDKIIQIMGNTTVFIGD